MSARQPLAAGAIVASLATVVLIGWTFDITVAKSVMAGWRVMVPGTAASLVGIGMALIFAAGHRSDTSDTPNVAAARSLALLAITVPCITFVEYVTGTRTGVENWMGVRFDDTSAVAGRISPIACLCLLSLGCSIAAGASTRARWIA